MDGTHDGRTPDDDFAEVFRCAPDVMAVVRTSDGVMLAVSNLLTHVSGYPREQVEGRSSGDFPWWPDEDTRDRILQRLRDQGDLHDLETTFVSVDGLETVWRVSTSPVCFRGQRCVVWRAADITAQRRAQDAERGLQERLREKQSLERLGLLAGGIAHDFNNLLVGVLGQADLALGQLSEDSPLTPCIRAIAAGAQRMAEHTRELLDYAGHTAVKLAPVQLSPLLREALDLTRPVLPSTIELRLCERHPQGALMRGDAGQLTRMLVNLTKNAAESLEGKPGTVEVVLDATTDPIAITIRDRGQGMDERTRTRMFDPFFSTKTCGSGLGLASVPGIVERHDGEVRVETAPEKGTTVVLHFPRAEREATQKPDAAPQRATLAKGRVLVVDDEAPVRKVACAMLEHLGFQPTDVSSGEQALAQVESDVDGYDLVLLDATMPGLNGAQTLQRLRSIRPELPVLLCSGYSRAEFDELLDSHPHTWFLTKPFRASHLRDAISTLLGEQ